MYFDLRCNSMENSEVLRCISMGIHDLHGNKVFVGLYWGFTCKWRMDQPGSANGLCPLAFEKSYVTLHAPKKPERFCGADVFETSVLAHEVELAAADCLQSAYVLSKATKLVRSTMLTGGTQRVRLRTK